jgi:1L-myo-inositol 1-phosphate cytidylyltransferase
VDAVILAAGYGSRLAGVSPCKPLTQVSGISLIELGIRQAARAGSSRVIVVTGHSADLLEAALPRIAEKVGVEVEAVRVRDWSLPNGYSVLAGSARADGNYLLMMADHVFSDPVLPMLVTMADRQMGATLAVDRRIDSPLVDPDDATWVETDPRGAILSIGKTITRYDSVDCGAFFATSALADAIQAAIDAGASGSLSDGMQRLATAGQAATVDIGDAWWIDVDDPRALALAAAQAPAMLHEVYSAANAVPEMAALAIHD